TDRWPAQEIRRGRQGGPGDRGGPAAPGARLPGGEGPAQRAQPPDRRPAALPPHHEVLRKAARGPFWRSWQSTSSAFPSRTPKLTRIWSGGWSENRVDIDRAPPPTQMLNERASRSDGE